MNEMNISESLSHILRAIDNNQYSVTTRETKIASLLPHALLESLDKISKNSDESLLDWYNFLNALLNKHQADKIFSTYSEKGYSDTGRIEKHFTKTGTGQVRVNGSVLEMVTLSEQFIKLGLNDIPTDEAIVIHLMGNFRSNLLDNLYLELNEQDSHEAIRFGNSAVSHTSSSVTVLSNTKVEKLYTILIDKRFCRVYLNGILYLCKARTTELIPSSIHFHLIGSLGADLSAALTGLEIWSSKLPIENLFSDEKSLFLARLTDFIQNRDLVKIHELLVSFDGFDIMIAEEQLLHLLSHELDHQQGYRDWVFEQLLSRVSPQNIETWYNKNVGKLPNPVLEVNDLSVEFYRTPNTRFSIGKIFRLRKQKKFKVLDNINFNVFPGDIIGIVGANGAGKSTLLKTISGMVPINTGNINLYARHLLLSAGLGARNELTGRENIYLSGCFMGLNKTQIDELYDEIVDFSELGEAIDRPFKYYSDGMKGRLVFSIATSVSPDILMLDELLSAGDIKFQQKASKRMDQLIKRAKVVVVVTHSTQFVLEKCNKALLLSHGRQVYYGDPSKAISMYLDELHMRPEDNRTDLGPTNITMQQQLNQSFGMPTGGIRAS